MHLAGHLLHRVGADGAEDPDLAPRVGDVAVVEIDVGLHGLAAARLRGVVVQSQALQVAPARQIGGGLPVMGGDIVGGIVHGGCLQGRSRQREHCQQ